MEGISKRNKFTYSAGCTGRDMLYILVSMFILTYIQYTMSLTIAQFAAISGVMIFARVWDAVNDPMMGLLIENSRFKSGKFRPWILIGGFTNFLITILLFTIRPEGWAFVVFFGIAYIAWGMTYTINDIGYWSLIPNLAKSNDERNGLTNLVVAFASIGQFAAGGVIPILVTGNAVMMYKILAIAISFIFLAFTLLTYFGVRENPRKDSDDKVTLKKMFKILIKNDQLVVVSIAILLQAVAQQVFIGMGLNFFYFEFGYGGNQMFMFTVFLAIGTLTSVSTFSLLTKKFKRMQILVIAICSSIIGLLIFLSLGYLIPMNMVVLYASAFFVFYGLNLLFITLVIMIANTIEYNEVLTGQRNESIVFSLRPFMTKLGSAIQQGVVAVTLIVSGVYAYTRKIADLEISKDQGVVGDITAQANEILAAATSSMKLMLRLGMALIPILCLIGMYFLMKKKYIISEEKYDEMLKELTAS